MQRDTSEVHCHCGRGLTAVGKRIDALAGHCHPGFVLIGADTEPTKVVLPTPKPPATTIFAEMVNEEASNG
jgi:hypothetical protein